MGAGGRRGGERREGGCVAELLGGVGTEVGGGLDEMRDGGEGVVADVADARGSVLAESIVACGLDRLEARMSADGLRITNSYSPGYCGWDVAEQHVLFSLLPEGCCGVRLCESGLMLPIKSVSAVVGSGPGIERKEYGGAW